MKLAIVLFVLVCIIVVIIGDIRDHQDPRGGWG